MISFRALRSGLVYQEIQVPYLIFKAIVAGFRGKVAKKNRTLGVPGSYKWWFRFTPLTNHLPY